MQEEASRLKEKVRRLPEDPGVYLMKDRLGSILYVGKAKNLKKRVSTYFRSQQRLWSQQPKVAAMLPLIFDVEVIQVRSEAEALLLEGQLIKKWKPKYNTDFVDDKQFPLIKVDLRQTLPRFRLTRVKNDSACRYYGPYLRGDAVRNILGALRRKFGVLLADASPQQLEDGSYQLYADARSELYGHENIVTQEAYHERVAAACAFLESKDKSRLEDLREKMLAASQARQYEKAAHLRDQLQALEAGLAPPQPRMKDRDRTQAPARAVARLQKHLGMDAPPRVMECFDISHISGTLVVASMVQFSEGLPLTRHYRRYRIRSFVGNDDFRAMHEVVGRRYGRLAREGQAFPDLIVIDGGKGQVSAALRAFEELGLAPPLMIGLAKREESIHFADQRPPLQLPLEDLGLRLLQRIRDEAHRFANAYSAQLRTKKITESVLDGFPGLGTARKAALIEHFGSLKNLKAASAEALAAAPGMGPQTAQALHAFLRL